MEILHKHKVRVFTQNMIGLPIQNPLEVDFETLDFNIKLKPYFGWSSILYPFPSTPIGKVAMDNGFFHGNFEDVNISNKSESCLDFKDPIIQRKINNLHKIFGIIVEFPILRPLTNFLISLPFTGFYLYLFFFFYGYKSVWAKISWKERTKMLGAYFNFFVKYVSTLEKKISLKQERPMNLGWKANKSTYPQPETFDSDYSRNT